MAGPILSPLLIRARPLCFRFQSPGISRGFRGCLRCLQRDHARHRVGDAERLPGVDLIQEREHPFPHHLRGGAIVLRQVRICEEVARAGVDVLLELCPGTSDVVAEGATSSSASTQGSSAA
jgi:hypothetical protein